MSILTKVLTSIVKPTITPSIFLPNIIRRFSTIEHYGRFQRKTGQFIKSISQAGDEHERITVSSYSSHIGNARTNQNKMQELQADSTLIKQLLGFNDPAAIEEAMKRGEKLPANSMSIIALYGHCGVIEVLIKYGVDHYDLNYITYDSSLMIACRAGNFNFANKLLDYLFNLIETPYEQWKCAPNNFALLQKAHIELEKFNIVTAMAKDWIDGRVIRLGSQVSESEKRLKQALDILTTHPLLIDVEIDYQENQKLIDKARVKAHQEELIRKHLAKTPKVFDTDTTQYKTSINGSCNKGSALVKVMPSFLLQSPTTSCWAKIQGAEPYSK